MSKKNVLVMNSGHEPLHHITPAHAIRMIIRGVAFPLVEDENRNFGPFKYPVQLVLHKPIAMGWYYSKPMVWSKSGVLRRDNRKCGYCGNSAATIDHVHPVSLGGKSTWENTVAACFKCNNKKGSKTLKELGWTLRTTPAYPRRDNLIRNGHTK